MIDLSLLDNLLKKIKKFIGEKKPSQTDHHTKQHQQQQQKQQQQKRQQQKSKS